MFQLVRVLATLVISGLVFTIGAANPASAVFNPNSGTFARFFFELSLPNDYIVVFHSTDPASAADRDQGRTLANGIGAFNANFNRCGVPENNASPCPSAVAGRAGARGLTGFA